MKRLQEIEGYVTIGLQGNELSRFLRLCSNHNIFVWNIIFVEWNMIQINLKARELFRTKEYLEKTKTHICYIQRRGLFFKLKRYRAKRVYLIRGVVSLFMLFLSFVWGAKNMVDFPPPLLETTGSYGYRNSFFLSYIYPKRKIPPHTRSFFSS